MRVDAHIACAFAWALGASACGRLDFDATTRAADAAHASDAPGDAPIDATKPDLAFSFTVDIGYVVAVGTDTTLLAELGGAVNGLMSGDIANCPVGLGPEQYEFPRASQPAATFVYVAAWDDEELARGMVGVIRAPDGAVAEVLTGDVGWQVCATGDYPGPMGPLAHERIAKRLTDCNAGTTPSMGWVGPAGPISPSAVGHEIVGPAQSTGVPLGPVCSDAGGVPPEAQWIWYHPTLDDNTAFTATGSDDDQGFLLFRHGI